MKVKLITRAYVVEDAHDEHLQEQADKRKMSKSRYLRMLIDEDMIGITK